MTDCLDCTEFPQYIGAAEYDRMILKGMVPLVDVRCKCGVLGVLDNWATWADGEKHCPCCGGSDLEKI